VGCRTDLILQIQFVLQVGVFGFTGPVHAVQKLHKADFLVFGEVLGGSFGSKAQDQDQGSQVVDRCIEALAGVHGDDDGADDGGAAGGIGRGDAKRPLKDHPTVLETPRK